MLCGAVVRGAARLSGRESPLRRLVQEASEFGEQARGGGGGGADELRWATAPYCARRAAAPATDPRHTTVLLFPGRGAARAGLGRRLQQLPAARDLYSLASSVLGWDVWRACAGDAAAGRGEAARADACVLVTALAALERVRSERPAALQRARAAAGVDVGELAALVFADALSLEAALRVLAVRAEAERACAAERRGATLAVWLAPDARLGAALHAARDHAAERGVAAPVCAVAAYLHPGAKLVAGDEEAIEWLEREGGALGVARAARVAGGARHTPLMRAAADATRAALASVPLRAPRLRVVSCASGRALRAAPDVARALTAVVTRKENVHKVEQEAWLFIQSLERQLSSKPLRWEQALQALYARPVGTPQPLTLVLGPHAALRHSLRQVNARAYDASLPVDV